ncbi:hypothetical protein OH491_24230 [Termitidicoccus mucosus]|uniref:Uncharacterized protein n=1 Tax=Termitidicoccus mucosus TaxID=1184151 RepID=A0A178IQE1_9BACT|nr:hypothetical protein AW736_02225 [Opitutaceae bacterium TSB47]
MNLSRYQCFLEKIISERFRQVSHAGRGVGFFEISLEYLPMDMALDLPDASGQFFIMRRNYDEHGNLETNHARPQFDIMTPQVILANVAWPSEGRTVYSYILESLPEIRISRRYDTLEQAGCLGYLAGEPERRGVALLAALSGNPHGPLSVAADRLLGGGQWPESELFTALSEEGLDVATDFDPVENKEAEEASLGL